MAWFLKGLNVDITNIVELQHYVELDNMLNMAISIDKQLNKKKVMKFGVGMNAVTTSPWKPNWRKGVTEDEKVVSKEKKVEIKVSEKPQIVDKCNVTPSL